MKRYLILAFIIAATCASNAIAQQDFFRDMGKGFRQQGQQMLQQELDRFQGSQQNSNQGQQKQFGGSLPSEGGQESGGRGQQYFPDDQYSLPGNGGGGWQPTPDSQSGNPFPNQNNYPGNSYDQYGNKIYPNGQTGSRIVTNKMPSSPVMSNQYIMIRCPQKASGSIRYILESNGQGFRFTISPGQEQRLPVGSGWIISFNSGAKQKRYHLEGGKSYTIKQDKQRLWEMYVAK